MLDLSLRSAEAETAIEQGWLLASLQSSFGLSQEELARRFDRSTSWVSRRLALVKELPRSVQQLVRNGKISSHAAMKHLVPMARAKPSDCERLAEAIAGMSLSTREVGALYRAWRSGGRKLRDRVIEEPGMFLKSQRELEQPPPVPTGEQILRDLDLVGVLARRVTKQYRECSPGMDPDDQEAIRACLEQAIASLNHFDNEFTKEVKNSMS